MYIVIILIFIYTHLHVFIYVISRHICQHRNCRLPVRFPKCFSLKNSPNCRYIATKDASAGTARLGRCLETLEQGRELGGRNLGEWLSNRCRVPYEIIGEIHHCGTHTAVVRHTAPISPDNTHSCHERALRKWMVQKPLVLKRGSPVHALKSRVVAQPLKPHQVHHSAPGMLFFQAVR